MVVSILCYVWQGHFTHKNLGIKQHPHKNATMIGTFPCVQSVASEHLWGSVSPWITSLQQFAFNINVKFKRLKILPWKHAVPILIYQWNWQPVVTSHAARMTRFSALNKSYTAVTSVVAVVSDSRFPVSLRNPLPILFRFRNQL
jgi:hypothetical protein